jgi:hypothetical protein
MSVKSLFSAIVFLVLSSQFVRADNTVTVTNPSPTANPTPQWNAGNGASVTFTWTGAAPGFVVSIYNANNAALVYYSGGQSGAPPSPEVWNFTTSSTPSGAVTLCSITAQTLDGMGFPLATGGSKVNIYTK